MCKICDQVNLICEDCGQLICFDIVDRGNKKLAKVLEGEALCSFCCGGRIGAYIHEPLEGTK